MSALTALPLEDPSALYLLNGALVVTVLAGLGLLAARTLARRTAPLRHAVLLATLLLLLLSPLAVALSLHWDLGVLALPGASPAEVPGPRAAGSEASGAGVASWAALAWRWAGPGLVTLWFAGMAWRAAVLLRGLRLVQRLRRSLRPVDDGRWLRLAGRASQAVGLRRPAEVAVSDLVCSPVSLGVLRQVIVVPASLEGALEEAEIEGILLHEAAHVARKDHLAGLLEQLARIAFWWNPLVQRLCGALDDAQEELCDNHVVRAQGSGLPFARCLVKVAEWVLRSKALPTAAGLLGRRGLESRVTNLLCKERRAATWLTPGMSIPLGLFVLAAGGLVVACTVKPAPIPPQPDVRALTALPPTQEMSSQMASLIPAMPAIPTTPAISLRAAVLLDANRPGGNGGTSPASSIAATRTTPAATVAGKQ